MGLAGRSRSPLFFFCTRHTPRTRWHDALKRAAGIAPFCCCCCSACDLNCFGESVRPSGRRREVRGRPGGRAWTAADRNRQPQATHTEGGVEVDTDVKAVTSVCLRGVRAASASSTDAGRSARSGRPDHARSLPPLPPSPVEFASQTQTQTSAAQACCRCTSARDPVARPRCCSPRVTRLRFPDPTGSAVGDPLRPAAGVVRRAGARCTRWPATASICCRRLAGCGERAGAWRVLLWPNSAPSLFRMVCSPVRPSAFTYGAGVRTAEGPATRGMQVLRSVAS